MAESEYNILDNYTNATYNMTFYVLPVSSYSSGPSGWDPNGANAVIIAQSGVTGVYGIEAMDVISWPSLTTRRGNTGGAEYNIRIREVGGAFFIDKLAAANLEIGNENFRDAAYYLEISFKGYEPAPTPGTPPKLATNLETQKWRLGLRINQVSGQINQSGATWELKCTGYGDFGTSSSVVKVKKGFKTDPKETLEETLTDVANKLNEISKEEETEGANAEKGLSDIYEIKVEGLLNDSVPFGSIKTTEGNFSMWTRTISTKEDESEDVMKAALDVENNTSVVQIINRVVAGCPDYQKAAAKSDTPTGKQNEAKANSKDFSQIHKVHTQVELTGKYDTIRQMYQKKITYIVKPYWAPSVAVDKEDIPTPETVEARLASYKKRGLLKRKYEYIFTGKNTDILNFDISLDNAWQPGVAVGGGWNTDISQVANGAKASDFNEQEQDREVANVSRQNGAGSGAGKARYLEDQGTKANAWRVSFSESGSREAESAGSNTMNNGASQGNSRAGKRTNSILNNAFLGNMGELMSINLTIRGDPYWMGSPNYNEGIDSMSTDKAIQVDGADTGQPAFELTMGVPDYQDEKGRIKIIDTLSGVYIIQEVRHVFEKGKFTQELIANVDKFIRKEE